MRGKAAISARARSAGKTAAFVAIIAVLNRLRGGLIVLPYRSLAFAAPLVGLALFAKRRDPKLPIAVAIGFFLWGFRSWSIWIHARFTPNLSVQPLDVVILDRLGQHIWFFGFFLRHWIMLWPLEIALLWLAPGWRAQVLTVTFAVLLTASYALGWRTGVHDGIAASEWIAGIMWGCYLLVVDLLVGELASPRSCTAQACDCKRAGRPTPP